MTKKGIFSQRITVQTKKKESCQKTIHAASLSTTVTEGRLIPFGHALRAGQLSENHCIPLRKRPAYRSDPLRRRRNILLSLKTAKETPGSLRPVSLMNSSATTRSCLINSFIKPVIAVVEPLRQALSTAR